MGEFLITNKTKSKIPRLPFLLMKNEVLGEEYELSVACVGTKSSRKLNATYRQKDRPTNILSFPLSKKEGEIVLCPEVIKKEHKKFGKNYTAFFGFLLIHGMLHLKGLDHSKKMEEKEDFYFHKFFPQY